MRDTAGMFGIVIAAGLGSRMGDLTAKRPKCLLPVAGRPLVEQTLEKLESVGCTRRAVVTGYLGETLSHLPAERFENSGFRENNILHSLLCAREALRGPGYVSYADIWVESEIYRTLRDTPGDLVLAVDRDWRPYYEGRQDHPLCEAENVFYDGEGRVREIGKHLEDAPPVGQVCGEFLGLWRMSAKGTQAFLAAFDEVDARLNPDDPFERALHWRKAYITDLIQAMVREGAEVRVAQIERGWAELDTEEDYRRLPEIAARQRLTTLTKGAQE